MNRPRFGELCLPFGIRTVHLKCWVVWLGVRGKKYWNDWFKIIIVCDDFNFEGHRDCWWKLGKPVEMQGWKQIKFWIKRNDRETTPKEKVLYLWTMQFTCAWLFDTYNLVETGLTLVSPSSCGSQSTRLLRPTCCVILEGLEAIHSWQFRLWWLLQLQRRLSLRRRFPRDPCGTLEGHSSLLSNKKVKVIMRLMSNPLLLFDANVPYLPLAITDYWPIIVSPRSSRGPRPVVIHYTPRVCSRGQNGGLDCESMIHPRLQTSHPSKPISSLQVGFRSCSSQPPSTVWLPPLRHHSLR